MPVPTSPQDLINIIREKLFNNTSGLIEEPDLREVLENIVKVLDAKFSMFSPTLTEEQYSQWNLMLDYMLRETKGVLTTSSPAPTGNAAIGKYLLSGAGTYTNLGGLVATADKLNYAYFDGTTWSKVEVAVPSGKSAYEVAVANGFVGTEVQWLASLKTNPTGVVEEGNTDAVSGGEVFNAVTTIMLMNEQYGVLSTTLNSDGVISSASIQWEDGVTGTLTFGDYNSDWLAYDSYTITYQDKIVTQPKVTRDINGTIIISPLKTIS